LIISALHFFRHAIPNPLGWLLLLVITVSGSTLINGFSLTSVVWSWGYYFVFAAGSLVFMRLALFDYLLVLRGWLLLMALLNLFSMVLFPSGLPLDNLWVETETTKLTWLWGFKNSLAGLVLPLLFFTSLTSYQRGLSKDRRIHFVAILVSFLTALLSQSSTLVLAIGLMLVVKLIFRSPKSGTLINIRTINVVWILAFTLLVFGHIQVYLAEYFELFFGKDASMSGRTVIWELALNLISKSPLFGLGAQGDNFALLQYNAAFGHTHSALLMILYEGGAVSLFLFVVFLFAVTTPLYKERYSGWALPISILIGCYYVILLTGSISSVGIISMLVTSYGYGKQASDSQFAPSSLPIGPVWVGRRRDG